MRLRQCKADNKKKKKKDSRCSKVIKRPVSGARHVVLLEWMLAAGLLAVGPLCKLGTEALEVMKSASCCSDPSVPSNYRK